MKSFQCNTQPHRWRNA